MRAFDFGRMASTARRETLELVRDPVRALMALAGSVILMVILAYGVTLDVENLTYAVLDRDQTTLSQNYALNIAGSRYFTEKPPIVDYADLDRRMKDGKLTLAIEIPAGTQPGAVFTLKGRGVPRLDGRGHGTLIVEIHVDVPTALSAHARQLLEALDEELKADPSQASHQRAVGDDKSA